jgi:UDP-N-acetylglucosamine 2-epimerase (non-hydrolysing)
MHKIAVFTGTRAEYGLLYWLMKAIQGEDDLELQVIVSGAHLSPQFGESWRDIEADGFKIDAKVEMLLSSDTPVGVIKSMGLATIGLGDALSRLAPDFLVVLGDRYEALAAAQVALIMNIPIVHIHGGELTFGAYDDSIRHAITKMASLHFVAAEPYKKRVVQMGEEAINVHNVGALGLEYLAKLPGIDFDVLVKDLNIPLTKPFFLITYHPVTSNDELSNCGFNNLLSVLDDMPIYQILFTYPNADNGGHKIRTSLERYCQKNPYRAFAINSLGHRRYLNVVAHSEAVIGNSSSGIIEVPSLKIPTINIGARQEGRLAATSVIHCDEDYSAITNAVKKVINPEFKVLCSNTENPYGSGMVSEKIVTILKQQKSFQIKKFQDVDFDYAN